MRGETRDDVGIVPYGIKDIIRHRKEFIRIKYAAYPVRQGCRTLRGVQNIKYAA